ncbi:MAG: hypothetical protein J5818_06595 [Eggerthellaceae bacterium]|nr:hypothetical protein [Eggerthellaceae bacterium]
METSGTITKSAIKQIVEERDHDALLLLFDADPDRVRRYLTRLAYDPDNPIHDEAIRCVMLLSRERGDSMPEFFLETMRRHIWAMNEEGGNIDWSAPEMVGAVVAGNPARFGAFFSFAFCAAVDELTFQPSLVKAFDLVAEVDAGLVDEFKERIEELRAALVAAGRAPAQ